VTLRTIPDIFADLLLEITHKDSEEDVLKGGIFLDIENLVRCGGWNMRFDAIRELVEAQGVTIVRANAYLAIDPEREQRDPAYATKKREYRAAMRRSGFHMVLKPVQRYVNDDGDLVFKANADIELAIDALLQAENLDYIMLGTGDGDFLRLVRALQARGRRADLLSFDNTHRVLRQEVDVHFSGFLYPGILPTPRDGVDRVRGVMHMVDEERGFGFITVQTGLSPGAQRTDVFVHITDMREPTDNREFARMKTREFVLEFTLNTNAEGKPQARNVVVIC